MASRTIQITLSATCVAVAFIGAWSPMCSSLSLSSFSGFHGAKLLNQNDHWSLSRSGAASWTMRKQKASDRRTTRLQRGGEELAQELIVESLQKTIISSPMDLAEWKYKSRGNAQALPMATEKTGGRGRSRKRSALYNCLSSYHSNFLQLLTDEFHVEVRHGGCWLVTSALRAHWILILCLLQIIEEDDDSLGLGGRTNIFFCISNLAKRNYLMPLLLQYR
jgi:hypothetical protein